MLDDLMEVIEESPLFVMGLIAGIIIFSVLGTMGWNQYIVKPAPAPMPIVTPIVITVTPSPTPTIKPSVTPTLEYETMTDEKNIPGAVFKRTKNDPAGIYYGVYYGERAVYIDIEKWIADGGRIVKLSGDLPGISVYTRFGLSFNSRYDENKNILFSLNENPFNL